MEKNSVKKFSDPNQHQNPTWDKRTSKNFTRICQQSLELSVKFKKWRCTATVKILFKNSRILDHQQNLITHC